MNDKEFKNFQRNILNKLEKSASLSKIRIRKEKIDKVLNNVQDSKHK